MNEETITKRRVVLITLLLVPLSFYLSYLVFTAIYFPSGHTGNKQDKLSGASYSTEDIHNYREGNRYGSAFVGFSTLTDRGVSDDDMRYIQDVLLNFTLYNRQIYNGTVSYVDGSFARESVSGLTPKYGFKVGINDKDIYRVAIDSDVLAKKITISIYSGDTLAQEKSFQIYPYDDNN